MLLCGKKFRGSIRLNKVKVFFFKTKFVRPLIHKVGLNMFCFLNLFGHETLCLKTSPGTKVLPNTLWENDSLRNHLL